MDKIEAVEEEISWFLWPKSSKKAGSYISHNAAL